MVFTKRISCLVLSVLLSFAVCAPCALGVFADDFSLTSTSTSSSLSSVTKSVNNVRSSWTQETPVHLYTEAEIWELTNHSWYCNPLYFVYDDGDPLLTGNSRNYNKSGNGAAICASIWWTGSSNTYDGPLLISPDKDACKTNQSTLVDSYINYNGIVIWGNRNSWIDQTLFTTYFPLYSWSSRQPTETLFPFILHEAGFVYGQAPAEPSDDGWTYGSTDLYFTNISDSNFAFNQTNYPFSSFPSKDIIVDDSPSKIIAGAFWDNTTWLSSGSTISGQLQVQFTSPLTSVDNFIQRGFIWFVNGSDPSLSGFQYFEVPTSWEYMFTVWKYGVNQWTNEYIFNFEFTLPDDLQAAIGFTPANILIGLYGILPSGSFTTECWYNVQNLVFGYYVPPSSGEPEVPSTPVFNNPDNTSTVINPSEPTVVDNLNEELKFYDNVWKSYNLTSDTFIDFFEEVIGFGATNLDDALGRLYQAFSYTGSGSIKLPSATIPWADTTLQLWEEQDIPLAYWFSNLPSPIKVVFGFIIVFSAASAVWGITFFFIRKIVSGNYQTSDF